MSTKSYTLADGTTATVNATDNGVPFNEGLNVINKAINAKICFIVGDASNNPVDPVDPVAPVAEEVTSLMNPQLSVTEVDSKHYTYTHLGLGEINAYGFDSPTISSGNISCYSDSRPYPIALDTDGTYAQDFVILHSEMDDIPRMSELADPELKVYFNADYGEYDGWTECKSGDYLDAWQYDEIQIRVERLGDGKIRAIYYNEELEIVENNETTLRVGFINDRGELFVGVESDGYYAPAFVHVTPYGKE